MKQAATKLVAEYKYNIQQASRRWSSFSELAPILNLSAIPSIREVVSFEFDEFQCTIIELTTP